MTADNNKKLSVPTEGLRRLCDPDAAVAAPDASDIIGQEEALASVRLGLEMDQGEYAQAHYNIAVVGPSNTGRTAKTVEYLRQYAAGQNRPAPDIICLPDPDRPRRPSLIFLPSGAGAQVKQKLDQLAQYAVGAIPQQVAHIHASKKVVLLQELKTIWAECNRRLEQYAFMVVEEENDEGLAYMLCPVSPHDKSEPMSDDDYDALSPEALAEVKGREKHAMPILEETMEAVGKLTQKYNDETTAEAKRIATKMLKTAMDDIRSAAGAIPEFDCYLKGLAKTIVEISTKPPAPASQEVMTGQGIAIVGGGDSEAEAAKQLQRLCTANLLVDNKGSAHPPVVHATMPQFSEMFGRINAEPTRDGGYHTDHTMIDGGSLLEANGGYLAVDIGDLLMWGGAIAFYKLLKVLRDQSTRIERVSRFLDAESLLDFRTKEVPVDIKVVVICDPHMVHVLRYVEPEFDNLFRVTAEFSDVMPFDEAPAAYAAFVRFCQEDSDGGLELPIGKEAIARLVEFGCRRSNDQDKVSTEFGVIKGILIEATHWAKKAGDGQVEACHVHQAVKARFDRQALPVRQYQEYIDKGILLLDHEGSHVGQVNALAVMQLSPEVVFGTPMRVTARAFAGPEKVILVQREAGTSGPSTDTATGVIRGYLAGQYGRKKPLSLAVQLCFEQTYGGIDGDSATLAETIALVSAITGLPVDQRLAITGSMNQWGKAQPIGGVNEKIEGHFFALKRRQLLASDGIGHGVVIPVQNRRQLMLDPEIVLAQTQGLYTVYAVDHIDQALELFLHRPVSFIHGKVKEGLTEMSPVGGIAKRIGKLFSKGNGDASGD